jgi:uncharacterized membrane protein YbhN (UPF0104 family)
VLASVAGGALAYLAFVLWSGWDNVAAALAKAGWSGVAVALVLSLVNYGLRFARWQLYVRAMGHPLPWRPSLQVYVSGFALTTTPGKAGETLRSVFLKAWGMPYTQSLACILGERMSDLLAIVLLSLWGLASYPGARSIGMGGAAIVIVLFAAMSSRRLLAAIARRFTGQGGLASAARHAVGILQAARRCLAPSLLVPASVLSVLAWAAEGYAFHFLLSRMGFDIAVPQAVSIYAVSLLAGAVTFVPGGVGSAEAVMLWLLHWSGVGTSQAVAATVLIRLATLWFAVVLGAIALAGVGRILPPVRAPAAGELSLTNDSE